MIVWEAKMAWSFFLLYVLIEIMILVLVLTSMNAFEPCLYNLIFGMVPNV